MATTTTAITLSSCTSSSTDSRGHPPPDSMDSDKRSLSDAGRQRLSSFPSRQRRMGPAPLASFEDLSMDKTTSDSSPEERTQLPEIGEETSGATTPVTPIATAALSVPSSPRIRVSAASSSSPHETDSKESTPEKELFSGYAKSDFCENMAADLHSSTEELDAEEAEQQRRRRERACKLAELERREEVLRVAELNRKGSSSSVISDGLLPVTSGHSSRLSSLGSIGSTRRSPSPHRMLLETSFCGSRPIQQPSIDFEDPPVNTVKMMDFAIESLERVKSPMEAKPPDIFRTSPATLPRLQPEEVLATAEAPLTKLEVSAVKSAPPSARVVATTPKKKPPPINIEANAETKKILSKEHEPIITAILKPPKEHQSTHPPKSPLHLEQTQQPGQTQQQHRQPLSSQSSPRSPRMPKKVPVPQVPDLKDLPRPSPSPSVASSVTATTPEYHSARSYSTTPSASPRASRRRRTRDEVESGSSSPSVSRKSSFTNLFRKSDSSVLSPVTPDSPGSSGRRSPFSQFIRSAKKEFRSRSRSRSRSKSRERDLEDDTHDRRSVLSIFRPKTKKKSEPDKGKPSSDTRTTSTDSKISEAITNVEFTFNDDGKYQSSSFGLIRQESEVNRAIKEPLRAAPTKAEPETPKPDGIISSRDSSYNELSSIMNIGDNKPSSDTIIVEESKENEVSETREITEDDVFDKPILPSSPAPPPPPLPPPSPSLPVEIKENEIEAPEGDKPILPPKQKDRTSEVDLTLETPAQDLSVDADSRSESERESEIEYLKKKASQQQGTEESLESPDVENKGLVSQDSLEEGELPYVPTTLPMERPLAAPMIPVKERATKMHHTQSIDRPRSTTPLIPGRLEEYKPIVSTPEGESDKMMINIPQTGPVKVLPTRSPKRQSSKTWEDFCQEGLRSPRTLRKQYRERSLQSSEETPPPLPPKARSPARSPITTPETITKQVDVEIKPQPEHVKSWINFDEMPDIVLKPVRQIKTVPPRHQAQQRQKDIQERTEAQQFKPQSEEQRLEEERTSIEGLLTQKLPPPLPEPLILQDLDSDNGQALSEASTPDKGDSSDHSSDSDKPTSPSSSEDLTTVRERIEEIKKEGDEYENSDLERLLAPVNDCINRLSSLSSEPGMMERRSPIPDNWSDFLLPPQPGRRSRLSSLGSDAGSIGGRSPSPSCMLLETSFCGSHPIDDPAAAEPDVPIAIARKLSGISLGDLSPFTVSRRDSSSLLTCPDRTSILSDSSAEGGGSPRDCDYYSSRQQPEPQRAPLGARHLNPFGMDLGVRSNRSSVVSQDQRMVRGAP
ncbi:serine/arginine repetitive matrix protein 1 isoform X2 [Procambarus clarkii]|uniref:serine/arginine repetitive matrix protein 1 isoform X2 n=1 Tax=Procambarus clarkii TaxID=6728 RepID=UPI001E671DB2|nr:serine/arginine repetitive matrix protein 1-like isoform X2 [Procambarus clarkii]